MGQRSLPFNGSRPKPGPLRAFDEENFEVLQRAFKFGDVALVSAIRKRDKAQVALVCAVAHKPKGGYALTPLAVMIEDNPFEIFYPPEV